MPSILNLGIASTNNIGPPLSLTDFDNMSRQRIDNWFRQVTLQVYGDAFSAHYNAAALTAASNVDTYCPMNALDYRTNNCLSGGIFTAPHQGLYQLNGRVSWLDAFSAGDIAHMFFNINGQLPNIHTVDHGCVAGETPDQSLSVALPLAAGDVVKLYVNPQSASSKRFYNMAFSGFFIRPI